MPIISKKLAKTGRQKWLKRFLLVGVCLAIILGLFKLTYAQSWRYKFDSKIGEFEFASMRDYKIDIIGSSPNCILVTLKNSRITCLSPKTGQVVWENWLPERASSAPVYSDKHQLFVMITAHGGLVGLDDKTGQIRWNFTHPKDVHWNSILISDDQQRITGLDRHNSIYALNLETGEVIWSYYQEATNQNNPKYFAPGYLYQSSGMTIVSDLNSGTIKAFSNDKGELLWLKVDARIEDPGLVEVAEGFVWYQTSYQKLNKVNFQTGQVVMSLPTPAGTEVSLIPGLIQVHSNELTIDWYGNATGQLTKTITLPGKIKKTWFDQAVFAIIYTGPYQEKLVKIDQIKGEIIWVSENMEVIRSIEQSSDSLVVIKHSGTIEWLDPKTGAAQASYKVQGEPRFAFSNPNNPQEFWVNVTHPGIYEEYADLNDILLFSKPGKLTKTWKDLAVDVSAGLLYQDRLWLIHQELDQLIGLSKFSLSQNQVWERSTRLKINLTQKLPAWIKINLLGSENLVVVTKTQSSFKGCMVDFSIQPSAKIISVFKTNPWINPWKDVKIEVKTKTDTDLETKNGGYYFGNGEWKATAVLADLAADKNLEWQASYQLAGKTFKAKGQLFAPKTCDTNVLKLNQLPLNLVNKNNQTFWGLGLQDVMLDYNEDGSVLDQWVVGDLPTPHTKLEDVKYVSSKDYLANYQQSGFNLFRLGFDNYSYDLWHQFDQNDFRGSAHKGLITDQLLNQLQFHNYYVIMTIFGFEPVKDLTHMSAYLDYVIARYSPWIDVWELSNEAWPDDQWVEYVSSYLKKHDPLNHPVTISWERQLNPNIDLASIHYYWKESPDEMVDAFVFRLRNSALAGKPTIVTELGNTIASWDDQSADRLRTKAWTSAWLKVPIVIWNHSRDIYYNQDNANIYLGPIEKESMRVLTQWLADQQAYLLHPITSPPILRGCYGLTDETTKMMFYCTNTSLTTKTFILNLSDWSKPGRIPFLPNSAWKISWYDPKTGKLIKSSQETGEILTSPAFQQDVVGVWELAEVN